MINQSNLVQSLCAQAQFETQSKIDEEEVRHVQNSEKSLIKEIFKGGQLKASMGKDSSLWYSTLRYRRCNVVGLAVFIFIS